MTQALWEIEDGSVYMHGPIEPIKIAIKELNFYRCWLCGEVKGEFNTITKHCLQRHNLNPYTGVV